MAIVVLLMVAVGPVLSALGVNSGVTKAAADTERTLEAARLFAISRQTYVRVVIAQTASQTGSAQNTLVLWPLCSADGGLTAGSAADMADESKWRECGPPLILPQFAMNDALIAPTPFTAQEEVPSTSDIEEFQRHVGNLGSLKFTACIQFSPAGIASVKQGKPARYIRLGIDRAGPQSGRNPVILRVAGNTGDVTVLRAEDGITKGGSQL